MTRFGVCTQMAHFSHNPMFKFWVCTSFKPNVWKGEELRVWAFKSWPSTVKTSSGSKLFRGGICKDWCLSGLSTESTPKHLPTEAKHAKLAWEKTFLTVFVTLKHSTPRVPANNCMPSYLGKVLTHSNTKQSKNGRRSTFSGFNWPFWGTVGTCSQKGPKKA